MTPENESAPHRRLQDVQKITFVCEQDGEIERMLKMYWIEYLKRDLHVTSACLASVRYGGSSEQKVALCLMADGSERRALVEQVSFEFRKFFKTTESLDIIFLSPEQQGRLLLVAKPFYQQRLRQP